MEWSMTAPRRANAHDKKWTLGSPRKKGTQPQGDWTRVTTYTSCHSEESHMWLISVQQDTLFLL